MPLSSPFLSGLAAYSPSSLPICKLYGPNPLGLSSECCLSKHDSKAYTNFETGQLIYSTFKITVDGDCSHEMKRLLHLGRKVITNVDSILKSRDITLPTMVHIVKAMVFPVVMYGCESWTIKKAEHRRIDAFELWCWRRFTGRTDVEAETPILWPPDAKN